jgi:hypothetical protein
VVLSPGPEKPKHVRPPPLGAENASDYALIVVAQGRDGRVFNAGSWKYGPK